MRQIGLFPTRSTLPEMFWPQTQRKDIVEMKGVLLQCHGVLEESAVCKKLGRFHGLGEVVRRMERWLEEVNDLVRHDLDRKDTPR